MLQMYCSLATALIASIFGISIYVEKVYWLYLILEEVPSGVLVFIDYLSQLLYILMSIKLSIDEYKETN